MYDIFSSQTAKTREFYDPQKVLQNIKNSSQFSRKIWGILSLELWHREFHDKAHVITNQSNFNQLEKVT